MPELSGFNLPVLTSASVFPGFAKFKTSRFG